MLSSRARLTRSESSAPGPLRLGPTGGETRAAGTFMPLRDAIMLVSSDGTLTGQLESLASETPAGWYRVQTEQLEEWGNSCCQGRQRAGVLRLHLDWSQQIVAFKAQQTGVLVTEQLEKLSKWSAQVLRSS